MGQSVFEAEWQLVPASIHPFSPDLYPFTEPYNFFQQCIPYDPLLHSVVRKIPGFPRYLSSSEEKTTPPPSAVPQTLRFLDLPGEIRNMIYAECLVLTEPIELWPKNHKIASRPSKGSCEGAFLEEETNPSGKLRQDARQNTVRRLRANLLLTSQQVCNEGSYYLYGHNTFRFTNLNGMITLDAFLSTIGPSNSQHLTDISVHAPISVCAQYWYDRRTHIARHHQQQWLSEGLKHNRAALFQELRKIKLHSPSYINRENGTCGSSGSSWETSACKDAFRCLQNTNLQSFSLVLPYTVSINSEKLHEWYLNTLPMVYGGSALPKIYLVMLGRHLELDIDCSHRRFNQTCLYIGDDALMGRDEAQKVALEAGVGVRRGVLRPSGTYELLL